MLFFVMRNRRVSLQLFVVMLVVLGTIIPEGEAAIKCHVCDGDKACKGEKSCADGDACVKIVSDGKAKKFCGKIAGSCTEGCYKATETNKCLALPVNLARGGPPAPPADAEICTCKKDLCNHAGHLTASSKWTLLLPSVMMTFAASFFFSDRGTWTFFTGA